MGFFLWGVGGFTDFGVELELEGNTKVSGWIVLTLLNGLSFKFSCWTKEKFCFIFDTSGVGGGAFGCFLNI